MRIARLLAPITVLGPGRRVALWVQGCTLACADCASVDTWDAAGGTEADPVALAERILGLAARTRSTGITVTGGEPFQQADDVATVLETVRAQAPDLDVLVFTGYAEKVAAARSPRLHAATDALVAGRYDATHPRGSALVATSNQDHVVRTELGRSRFAAWEPRDAMQVSADGGDLYLVGIPRAGDLDRLGDALTRNGIELEGVSWQA